MQIKVNQEIRDIKDEFLSGLSVRQTIWSAAALCAGFITFWNVYTCFGSTDMASFLTLCASAPLALIGFFKWHKMPAERVALCWLHALLMPRRLVFKGRNIHANEIEQLCTAARAVELNEMKNRREKGKDALETDLEGRGAVSTGKHENSAQHAGDDPGQAHSE